MVMKEEQIICRIAVVRSSPLRKACTSAFARDMGEMCPTNSTQWLPSEWATEPQAGSPAFCGQLATVKFHNLLGEQIAHVFSLFLMACSGFFWHWEVMLHQCGLGQLTGWWAVAETCQPWYRNLHKQLNPALFVFKGNSEDPGETPPHLEKEV